MASAVYALDPAKQFGQYVHERWNQERGFLGGTVYAISQSNDGYLWIGTERGLVRFDGFSFTLIQQPIPELGPTGPVRGLLTDAEGNLWIRLETPNLLVYRDGKFENAFARYQTNPMIVTAMSHDAKERLLIAGLADRTLYFERGAFSALNKASTLEGTVISIAQARDSSVWMGTRDDGLYRTGINEGTQPVRILANKKINALLPASNGGIWIGTDDGLIFLDSSGRPDLHLPAWTKKLQILSLIRDRDSNVWAGTNRGLLRIATNGALSLSPNLQPDDSISVVYEDRNGDIWTGDSDGIERLSDGMFTTYSRESDLPPGKNGSIYVDSRGRTWVAPLNGELYYLDHGKAKQITVDGIANDVVYSITGGPGEIWLGRQKGGLTRLTEHGNSFTAQTYSKQNGLEQDSVFSIYRSSDGKIWAGTVSAGISCLDGTILHNYSMPEGLISNAIASITEDDQGTMWFATPLGLQSFAKGQWKHYTVSDGLPSSNVTAVFEDSQKTLWVATTGGLAYFSSSHLRMPRRISGALREQIQGIAEDGLGFLWFVTSDHVLQVNRDELMSGDLSESEIHSFGMAEGLRGMGGVRRDHSIVSDKEGRIWVSLNQGIAVADPKRVLRNLLPVGARIESMLASGIAVDLQGSRKIAPQTTSIAFRFSGATLSSPGQIRFRYKLDGSDENWSDVVALREVSYRNLGPGTYRFRVIASNYDGLWNGPETSVTFFIERAYWQTTWFRALCILSVILFGSLFYRLRTYQLTRDLNTRFQERLAERTRIAQELHDTLLQSFQGLMLRFQTGINLLPNKPDDAKHTLEAALDKADLALLESRNAIQNIRSRASNLDLAETMNAIMSSLKEEAELKSEKVPSFHLLLEGNPKTVNPLLHDDIYNIARESLRNSFQHAQASQVEAEISYGNRLLRIRFRDDGIGINPSVLEKGQRTGHWGLVGMQERASRIGARLDIWSKSGAGTEIELRLPGQIAYESNNGKNHDRNSGRKEDSNGN